MSDQDAEPQAATPRPGTTASLEARVGRLERQYDTLSGVVNVMAVDVAVTREKVVGIDAGFKALAVEVGKMLGIIQTSLSDPAATPAGKAVELEIERLRTEKRDDHSEFTRGIEVTKSEVMKLKLWVAGVGGGLTVLVFVMNIFAPAIRRAFGLG